MKRDSKIVFCACHEVGIHLAELLINDGFSFDYIVTLKEIDAIQEGVSGFYDFTSFALKNNIPIYYVEKYSLKTDKDLKFFNEGKFDLLIQGGWQRLFPQEILETLRVGAVGVHGSAEFLPFGRGRSPINWSIIEGRKRFIFHYFILKPGIDDGDIFCYKGVDINESDDCYTLYLKNSLVTYQVLKEYIPKLLSGNFSVQQQNGIPTYYEKRTPDMGKINWAKDLFQIVNFIKAQTKPYPGAFAFVGNEKIMIWKAQPFDTRIDLPEYRIGEVILIDQFNNLVVKVIGGLILITDSASNYQVCIGDVLS